MSDLKKSSLEKINGLEDYTLPEEKKKYKESESKNCCSCSKTKTLPAQGDEAESQIQFEDFLHNKVYIKNPHAVKTTKNVTSVTTASPIKDVTSDAFNETFTSRPGKLSSVSPSVENVSEVTTTSSPEIEDGHFHYKVEKDMFLSVKNLHHFTEYTIEVRACQNKSDLDEPCSSQSITTVRTLPLGGADDIDVNSIVINQENLTSGILFFKWDEPKDFNGLIVNYHIEIKSAEASEYNKATPTA